MLYFRSNSFGHLVEIATDLTPEQHTDRAWECRADGWDAVRAQRLAAEATSLTGELHVATDTPSQYPRFDVVRAPRVGDLVSYAFNGDSYPDGEIVKVSPTLQVTTSTGSKYLRRKQTGTWKRGGTWCLVKGHHSERNPHF